MLHAARLAMTHPQTNQPLSVEAPLPEDFLAACAARGIVPPKGQSDQNREQLND
jgi:hypothetical protein